MKKFLAFLLIFATLFSFVSCAAEPAETKTDAVETAETSKNEEEKRTEEEAKTEDKGPVTYATVTNPLTPERIAEIPIANSSMSIEEIRQICVDFISLQVSFTWVPTQSLTYRVDRHGVDVSIEEGKLYGGIPYVNVASGNIYRILRCYDTETGHLDINGLNVDKERFGTACSGSAGWGWARAINSAKISWTGQLTPYHGCIPVGPYETLSPELDRFGGDADNPNSNPSCKELAKKNGEQVMFESYALMHVADGLVNDGHVTMCSSEPVVVRDPATGTIDGENSYILWCEQGLYTTSTNHDRVQDDGTPYKIQGNVNLKKTFKELYSSSYLPFTFAEFLGTDPVEDAEIKVLDSNGSPVAGTDLSVSTIQKLTIEANYPISDVHTIIRDAEGNVVLDYAKPSTNHFVRSWSLGSSIPATVMNNYVDQGGFTVELSAQLGNGAKPIFYTGNLTTK